MRIYNYPLIVSLCLVFISYAGLAASRNMVMARSSSPVSFFVSFFLSLVCWFSLQCAITKLSLEFFIFFGISSWPLHYLLYFLRLVCCIPWLYYYIGKVGCILNCIRAIRLLCLHRVYLRPDAADQYASYLRTYYDDLVRVLSNISSVLTFGTTVGISLEPQSNSFSYANQLTSSQASNLSEHPVSSTPNYNVDLLSNQLDSTQPPTSPEHQLDAVSISNSSEHQSNGILTGADQFPLSQQVVDSSSYSCNLLSDGIPPIANPIQQAAVLISNSFELQSSVISSGSNHFASSSSELVTNQLATRDWTAFTADISSEIVAKLPSGEDFLSYGEVCSHWRHGISHINWNTDPQCPSLMLSENGGSNVQIGYNFDRNEHYEIEMPAAHGRRCFTSPDGMILTLTRGGTIHHLNLLSQDQKRLPRLRLSSEAPAAGDWFYFIHKLMVFKRFPNDRIVMAICGSRKQLAFVRLGEEGWKAVKNVIGVRDVALYGGQFYALRDSGILVRIIFSRLNAEAEFIAEGPKNSRTRPAVEIYLVASHIRSSLGDFSADLLGVFRYGNVFDRGRETRSFKVYKLDFNKQRWKRLKELGERAIFVGEGNSWSINASNFIRAKSNMIYYTDDYWRRPRESTSSGYEVGLFDLFGAGDVIHIDVGEVTSSDSGEEVVHNEKKVADNDKEDADNDEEVIHNDEEVEEDDDEVAADRDEEVKYGHDVGVFSMASRTMELSRELLNLGDDNPSDSSRPIWITSKFLLRFFPS